MTIDICKQNNAAEELWKNFLAAGHTFKPDATTLEQWHKGRPYYQVWMYRFDQDELLSRMDQISYALLPYIKLHRVTNLHMTVFVAGFACTQAIYNDDFPRQTLHQQVESLKQQRLQRPVIQVKGLNSTLTGPILSATDLTPTTDKIRRQLQDDQQEVRFAAYVPHITLGHYLETEIPAQIAQHLAAWRDLPALQLKPNKLELVQFDAMQAVSDSIALCRDEFDTVASIDFINR